jgi:hypothetical protein
MAKTSRSNSRTGRTVVVRYARPGQNGEAATSTSCMRASAVSTRPRCGQRMSPTGLAHCKFANTTRKAIYGRPAAKTAPTAHSRRTLKHDLRLPAQRPRRTILFSRSGPARPHRVRSRLAGGGTGFEPSVPGCKRVIPFWRREAGKGHGDDTRRSRDGECSNPAPSTGENLTRSIRAPKILPSRLRVASRG